jgi:hypothetical protein
MFIKVAHIEDPRAQAAIVKSSKLHNCEYVILPNNHFALMTHLFSMEYGCDDANNPKETNIRSFVETFMDAKKAGFLYNGINFTNMFYIDALVYCHAFNIPIDIDGINVTSQYGTEDTLTDEEDIVEFIRDIRHGSKNFINKLHITYKNISIIIDSNGYVDIAARETFCEENKSVILNIIKAGLEE